MSNSKQSISEIEAGLPINVSKVSDQLTDTIVSSYGNITSKFIYKSSWCSRIAQVLSKSNISYNKPKPNWENISMLINDKRLGIVHPNIQPFEAFPITNDEPAGVSKNSSSLNASSSASPAPKQPRLSLPDKDYIKKSYEDFNETSMWKLSSGVVVEKKMEEFALACDFEHPVHSLVLDLGDESWKKYFSDQDIAEMMNYNEKKLPELPAELNNLILEARKLPDADSFKQYLKQEFGSTACEWAKDTVLAYIKLFKYQKLPLNHQTEGDMLRRIWFFSRGEKSSKSSCVSRNLGRTLAAIEKMDRKFTGRKVDMPQACA
ncbi:hypothetical protein INT47_005480 [Mucor saturninus]|uniref:Uncharacterized protein n=1 Tax=Mucor saturninus TaxID=64648 RepID=A0A8H7RGE2_9FUNG|nr:hypothetical protein INT47_005480 [Mucor saturninus]